MKHNLITAALAASLLTPFMFAAPAIAAKTNSAGAQTYAWHLSSDVMPVPPYGSQDIAGSDTASKLIVNQPNGKVLVNMTGVMRGLNPSTEYTVYLSNVYTPYEFAGWNVAKSWVINVNYLGVDYPENLVLQDNGGTLTGTLSLVTPPGASPWTIDSGSVTGDSLSLHGYYNSDTLMKLTMTGTIAVDGTMSGTWADEAPGTRSGTWMTTNGQATKNYNGSAGWTGLLTPTVQPFTFVTDETGSGSWHLNLKTVDITLPTSFSVWINGSGATLLISDPITLN